MEDFTAWGNAAAVPLVVAITQILKRIFNFKRKADVISLLVSLAVCFGWEFYHTPEAELFILWTSSLVSTVKHLIDLLIVSFATWMSASKTYDLFLGEKRRAQELNTHLEEKEALKQEVETLKNGTQSSEAVSVDQKVREILEGK